MRLPRMLSFAVAVLVCGTAARAQEVKYWPLNKISFPIDVAAVNQLNPKPAFILFYSAPPTGKFTEVFRRKPNDLEDIVDTKDPGRPAEEGGSRTRPPPTGRKSSPSSTSSPTAPAPRRSWCRSTG